MRSIPHAAWLAVGAGILVSAVTVVRAVQSVDDRQEMRENFQQRLDAYVALHREIELLLPPETVTSDLDVLFAPRMAMNREMRKARSRARQGDIFTPGVSVYFRVVIAETLRRHNVLDLHASIVEESPVVAPPTVNADYPAGQPTPLIPPCLIAALPPLPPEVRYSFIGNDLILWDLHAGLIVDFVPRALPVITVNAETPTRYGDCAPN